MTEQRHQKRKCFVITPFKPEFDRVFNKAIEPVIGKLHLKCVRADHSRSPGSISPEIYKDIAQAKLIIADVTGLNPNVLYELGIAHTMGKRVVIITQQLKKLPFDIKHIRAFGYKNDDKGLKNISTRIYEAAQEVLFKDEWANNPFQKYLPSAPFRYLTHIHDLVEYEAEFEGDIHIITWDLINDLGEYKKTIIGNLKKMKHYKYILPKNADIEADMEKLMAAIRKQDPELVKKIDVRYTSEDASLECTIVIYGVKGDSCHKVFIMPSSVTNANDRSGYKYAYEYAYEVVGDAKNRIFRRFKLLWDGLSKGT